METVLESDSEEPITAGETQKEEETARNINASSLQDFLLGPEVDTLSPESYRLNSPGEIRLLTIADNFRQQYSHLYPDRKPLLLCPANEFGVKKFVSVTLRPMPAVHLELCTWEGCASFVADFLSLEPLKSPVNVPCFLFSPSSVLRSQRATCFEFATLLCSLLLGSNYDAYCVSGYAIREMCLLDQSLQECPLLDTQVESEITETQPLDNKYTVKPPQELKSRFVMQQEKKKYSEPMPLQEQELQEESEQRAADPLQGLRVHCWVLVLSGSRGVRENFFIDPLTGKNYATNDHNFLGIESVWNNLNYYVNMQDCSNGCADLVYDLADLKTWEPVLYGAIGKKQLIVTVSKKKEDRRMLNIIPHEMEEDEEPWGFEMPRSWVSFISISKRDLEGGWPGGTKVTRYRKAKVERFTPYLRPDGVVTRLTTYKDLDCTEVVMVREWYQHRNDHLEEREVNKVDNVTTERFRCGKRYNLLIHRDGEMEFSGAHVDDLVRRVVTTVEMTENFEGRDDFLYHRRVVFNPHAQFSDSQGDALRQSVQEVVERFHRNRSKPANQDVAERMFLLDQRRIEITYHLEDHRFIPSKRSFIKPQEATLDKKAESFIPDMVSSFQVDPCEKPLSTLALYEMLVALMKDEDSILQQISKSKTEVKEMVSIREQEDRDVQLCSSPWSTRALRECSLKQEVEQKWLQEENDILAPFLIRIASAETLNAGDAKQLYHDCLAKFKERLVEEANLIQEHYEKETQELQRKQQWYQENQLNMKEEQEAEYHDYCTKKTQQIQIIRKRLSMHRQEAPLKYRSLDGKLKGDPRLAPHLLTL